MIAIEDLKVSNMSRSAKGDMENPGTNVKAKSGLNKSILDQGWHEFRRQLEYKQAWLGGIVAVPPQYTSQRCPCCLHVSRIIGNHKPVLIALNVALLRMPMWSVQRMY